MANLTDSRLLGAPNFRDIGGWETTDGRRVRRGRLFRSGELSNLLEADFDMLRRLRVGCIVDLRASKERGVHASKLPHDLVIEHHHADITLDVRIGGRPIFELLRDCATPDDALGHVSHSFKRLSTHCGPALSHIVDRLLVDDAAVLFHCTNGRDRTGAVAALLLTLLDASRTAVVADFMLTNERIDIEKVIANSLEVFHGAGVDVDRRTMELVTLVRPQLIIALFEGIDADYCSLDNYFDHFGIDAAKRALLRERLIVEHDSQ